MVSVLILPAGANLAAFLLPATSAGDGGCSEPLGVPAVDQASAGTPLSGGTDYVTGGGYICGNVELGTTGVKTNFGFEAGNKANGLGGNLNLVDHGTGMHFKADTVDSYSGTGNARTFSGTATVDGVSGFTYGAYVEDNATPGRNADVFQLTVSNGYFVSGQLGGGNIQIHA